MRFILAIVTVAALGWTGWWWFIASAKENAIENWLAGRRADGWVAEASAIEVKGFPYRVDTTLRELELANPDAGWAWSAPTFQFLTLAYEPNHIIAIWPQTQTIATPFGATGIRSENLMGSIVVEPNLRLALDRSAIEIEGLTLDLPGDDVISMTHAQFNTRQSDDIPFAHEIAFSVDALGLPKDWLGGASRAGLAPVIDTGRIDAVATFDRPWDRPAIEGEPPALLSLEIRDVTLAWGELNLRGRGDLVADAEGYAAGSLEVRARNWKQMLTVAEQSGALSSGVASAIRGGLGLIASLGGDANSLDAPLEFEGGRMFLGPIPIGRAPRLNRP
jgi:hypothetical protein